MLREMGENRLWRVAAQRSVRNAWGRMQGQLQSWSGASAAALSAATNLVNAFLSHGDADVMDLGVLSDMDGIRDKAKIKLRAQQELELRQYLKSYDALLDILSEMRSIEGSMRTHLKDSQGGSLIEFTKVPVVNGDKGDGRGVAVFSALPLQAFEVLAKDLVTMFEKELRVKWLLALEFHNLVHQMPEAKKSQRKKLDYRNLEPLTYFRRSEADQYGKLNDASAPGPAKQAKPPARETLQYDQPDPVNLIDSDVIRIEEVSRLWNEEMTGDSTGSPQR